METPDHPIDVGVASRTAASHDAPTRARIDPVWLYNLAIATIGVLLVLGASADAVGGGVRVPLVALALWFALCELLGAHVGFRDSGVDTALSGAPMLVGLAFLPVTDVAIAATAGALLSHGLRSDEWRKLLFNVAIAPLHVGVAAAVLTLTGGGVGPLTYGEAARLAMAVALSDLATLVVVVGVIWLASGARRPAGGVGRSMLLSLGITAVTAAIGLTGIWAATAMPISLWLTAGLTLAVAVLFQLAAHQLEQTRRLGLLERGVADINRAKDGDDLRRTVVEQARLVANTSRAAVLVRTPRGFVHEGDAATTEMVEETLDDGLPRFARRRVWARAVWPTDEEDLAVVALGDGPKPEAALVVERSIDATRTLGETDLRLLADLARHAGAAGARLRLIDLLRQEVTATERAARTDALTQLPNRDGLVDALAGGPARGLVVVASVEGVTDLTAAFGRSVADGLLIELAGRLTTLVGPTRCARLADATFAVWLPAGPAPASACRDVITTLSADPVHVDQVELGVSLRVGAVEVTSDVAPDEVLRRARVALSASASDPVIYTRELDDEHARRLRLTRELRDALAGDQLSLHYQPKADLATGRLVGVEALARWIHPELGFVPPLEFVGLAERSGTIGDLTAWAIDRACREASTWAAQGRELPVAVNLSPRDLLDPALPPTVARALADTELDPRLLRLEITESVMVVDPERSREVVDHLRSTGVSISIDDFGAGYASFGHLRRFAVDELKIDRSLVMELDAHGDAIVRAIVALADELELKTVAEGVEDEATWQRLADAGVDACQGWHLAKPMAPADLEAWLADNPARLDTVAV